MTLPYSGNPISMSQVNVELGYASNATISLNDTDVRALAGKASGTISLNDFHGKSSGNPDFFQFVYTSDAMLETNNIRIFKSIADKNEVEIEVINHNPELLVSGDKKQLVTALKNLLLNAIYHTGNDKKVFINVEKTTYFVEINVKDSGDGISPEDQLRIFERFYRVDTARSRQDGGSGIGLSLVKHISLNHGGRAMVESKLGFGATFTIQLPLKENI